METKAVINELKVLQQLLEEKQALEHTVITLKESSQQELRDFEHQLDDKVIALENNFLQEEIQMKQAYGDEKAEILANIATLKEEINNFKNNLYEVKREENNAKIKDLEKEPTIISFFSKLKKIRNLGEIPFHYLHPVNLQEWFFYVIGALVIYFILSFIAKFASVLFFIIFLIAYPVGRLTAIFKSWQESSRYLAITDLEEDTKKIKVDILTNEKIEDPDFLHLKEEQDKYTKQLNELEQDFALKEQEILKQEQEAIQALKVQHGQALLKMKEEKLESMKKNETNHALQQITDEIKAIPRPTDEYKTLHTINMLIRYLINDQAKTLGEAITRYDDNLSKTIIAEQEIKLLKLQEEKFKLEEERENRKELRWHQQLDDEQEREIRFHEQELELQKQIEAKDLELKQLQIEQESQYNKMKLDHEKEYANELIQLKIKELENNQAINQRQMELELQKVQNDAHIHNNEWKAKESRLQEVQARIAYANKMEDGPKKIEALEHLNRLYTEMLGYLADEVTNSQAQPEVITETEVPRIEG